jgi:hypothetical protein
MLADQVADAVDFFGLSSKYVAHSLLSNFHFQIRLSHVLKLGPIAGLW